MLTVGDEGLAAVDDIGVAFSYGGGPDRLKIRTCAGLRHRYSQHDLSRADTWQPSLLLLQRSVGSNVGRHPGIVQGDVPPLYSGPAELFAQEDRRRTRLNSSH